MNIDFARCRELLNGFETERLIVEHLGWDRHGGEISVEVGGETYLLNGLAQKRGVQVLECRTPDGVAIPDYNTRKKIEKQVTKSAYEHLIVFTDTDQGIQVWQWVARAPGKPDAYRETTHHPGTQSGDLLLQKLQGIRFTLDEEESIDIAGASHRLRDAFDRDAVTKKFYKRFKDEQQAFLGFIDGITNQADRKWYASLMLNRLMFVWFIQEKGFLDGDKAYLQNRFARVRERKGEDKFHTFYRYFLLALFHEGFGKRKQDRHLDRELTALLGRVPYLNGGLFDPHRIEEDNESLQIPDKAFERLFAFFGEFDWHLDTRAISQGNEINPDVLGYIFEKYINQKQMGAYYTKEDITEYISKNTVLPFLFDAAKRKCKVAFQPGSAMWRMLQDDPDAFVYPAMRKGVIDAEGNVIPLPPEIEKGVDTTKPNLLERRKSWNAKAAGEYALPTEIWREHVARRQRCLEIREMLCNGNLHEINDLITYNLNIRQFAERAISECEGPELLRAFWQSVRGVTILDPTCGSGAFLFAALDILFPLYEACLTRMQGFVEDLDRSGAKRSPKKFSDFRDVLADIDRHPSRDYFILKSIIVHNLYGVDIMPEAVEICKLRLFLKLVAQVETVDQLEPLPDIDFNIRAGNTLVGFTSMDEIREALSGDLIKQLELPEIEEQAEIAARAYELFQEMQTQQGMNSREFTEAKQDLREKLTALEKRLNVYLAGAEYGIDPKKQKQYEAWVLSHQPFHWVVEFYGIMAAGGFDVIIGNPPFVENTTRNVDYKLCRNSYATLECGNLYAFVSERSTSLLSKLGSFSFIMPSASICTPRMAALDTILRERFEAIWTSVWDERPSKLFEGVDQQLAIQIGRGLGPVKKIAGSPMRHWAAEERDIVFATLAYVALSPSQRVANVLPKIGSCVESVLLRKIFAIPFVPSTTLMSGSAKIYYRNAGGRYWRLVKSFPSYFRSDTGATASSTEKTLSVSKENSSMLVALFSSSLFYWYWRVCSNCRHLTDRELGSFPVAKVICERAGYQELIEYASRFEERLKATKHRQTTENKRSGTVVQDVFRVSKTKPIIDEIDRVLAKHYGFTDEELDFIINYDIKYRMGGAEETD